MGFSRGSPKSRFFFRDNDLPKNVNDLPKNVNDLPKRVNDLPKKPMPTIHGVSLFPPFFGLFGPFWAFLVQLFSPFFGFSLFRNQKNSGNRDTNRTPIGPQSDPNKYLIKSTFGLLQTNADKIYCAIIQHNRTAMHYYEYLVYYYNMEELPKINDKLTLRRPYTTPNETHYLITKVTRDRKNPMSSMITFMKTTPPDYGIIRTASWDTIKQNGYVLVREQPQDINISKLNLYDNTIVDDFIITAKTDPNITKISNAALMDKMNAANLVERVLNYTGHRSSFAEMSDLTLINEEDSLRIQQNLYSYIRRDLTGKNGGSRRRKTHSRRSKKSRRYRRIRRR